MPRKRVLELPQPTHKLPAEMKDKAINIALVGCGGNGAQMLTKLARLDYALRQTVNPDGLRVFVFDPDTVSPSNVGRQCFSPSDVGLSKAVVLTNRINAYYGLQWHAHATKYEGQLPSSYLRGGFSAPDLLVSCVDTAEARRKLNEMFEDEPVFAPRYWLDLGNKKSDGQVILGQPLQNSYNSVRFGVMDASDFARYGTNARVEELQARLQTVVEVFPELLDASIEEDDAPTCSVADALSKQSLFVNDMCSDWAMQMLDDLLRLGEIRYCGAFVNLESGRVNALPIPTPQMSERAKAA